MRDICYQGEVTTAKKRTEITKTTKGKNCGDREPKGKLIVPKLFSLHGTIKLY